MRYFHCQIWPTLASGTFKKYVVKPQELAARGILNNWWSPLCCLWTIKQVFAPLLSWRLSTFAPDHSHKCYLWQEVCNTDILLGVIPRIRPLPIPSPVSKHVGFIFPYFMKIFVFNKGSVWQMNKTGFETTWEILTEMKNAPINFLTCDILVQMEKIINCDSSASFPSLVQLQCKGSGTF